MKKKKKVVVSLYKHLNKKEKKNVAHKLYAFDWLNEISILFPQHPAQCFFI